jgi:hypothetical protein
MSTSKSKKPVEKDEDEEISTVRIDRSEAQLSVEEQVEVAEACGYVRDEVHSLHNHTIGLTRQGGPA